MATGAPVGDFDLFALRQQWAPQWCTRSAMDRSMSWCDPVSLRRRSDGGAFMALHGLWPQWAESCSHEKFDYRQIQDLADELKEYWPSCQGSAQDFWEHEWSKHGTCSGMSQHDFFSTAITLCKKYRGQCSNSNDETCNICLDKNLDSTETCDSSNGKKYANIKTRFHRHH